MKQVYAVLRRPTQYDSPYTCKVFGDLKDAKQYVVECERTDSESFYFVETWMVN